MMNDAEITSCRRYRYALWRVWGRDTRYVMFVGLNPSTADAEEDDPTLRRCVGYARSWGYDRLCIGNLFAYRATDPNELCKVLDPIGPNNDEWLARLSQGADKIVAAWGNRGHYMKRDEQVMLGLGSLHCLGLTKRGQPKHPLYLRKDLKPIPWMIGLPSRPMKGASDGS